MAYKEGKDIKSLHKGSLINLLYILNPKDLVSLSKSPLILSIAFTICYCIISFTQNLNSYTILSEITETTVSLLPNLLGFTLAGLTIIVAFGNQEYLESLSNLEISGEKLFKPSLFQRIIAVFTWSVLVQSFCLSFGYIIKLALSLKLTSKQIVLNAPVSTLVNYLTIFLLLLLFLYSLFLIPKTILNVFMFGQGHHLSVIIKKRLNK